MEFAWKRYFLSSTQLPNSPGEALSPDEQAGRSVTGLKPEPRNNIFHLEKILSRKLLACDHFFHPLPKPLMKEEVEVFIQKKMLTYDTSAKIIYNLLDFIVTLPILK